MTEKPNKKSAGQPPVSAHPAFPVIVAVWFAALLAIGSMVLPLALFENLAVASGLADSFAFAQPPLGTNAHIAVAIVAAVFGALLGIFVARQVAAAAVRGATSAALAPRFSPKRPLSAHDELGEGGIDAADDETAAPTNAFTGRRRALAATDDSAASECFAAAPLPGDGPVEDEPLDLLKFEQARATEPDLESAAPDTSPSPKEPVRQEPRTAERPIGPPVAERPLSELGMVELVERFAIALERHRERAEETPAAAPAPVAAPLPPSDAQGEPAPDQWDALPARPLPVALRPFGFDEPSIEDHDEGEEPPAYDFGAALSQRRDALPAEPEGNDAFGEAGLEEEFDETAEAEYTSLLSIGSPLGQNREPVRMEHPGDDDDSVDGPVVVFPGQAGRRAASRFDDDHAADSGAGDSLRALGERMARVEQAAAGAPHTRSDAGDTERALRDALERLQKMSGAA